MGELAPHQDFWVIVSGGKHDFAAKWWDPGHWQEIVDHFSGGGGPARPHRLARAGAGDSPLQRRGDPGEPAHAPGRPVWRPCVVVAGGREPLHWEAYPQHQYIHTLGVLTCCAESGWGRAGACDALK